jgi:ABC-type polysaccharide/polyol phosphate export permease
MPPAWPSATLPPSTEAASGASLSPMESIDPTPATLRAQMPATIPRPPGPLEELHEFRHVLYQLVRQQLILRYRRTMFGYLWTLFNPLLMMSVTAVVFSTIFKLDLKSYAIFLFSGMIAFNFFSTTVTQSGNSLITNEGLIKKIYIPKLLFPLAVGVSCLIDSVLTAASLFLIILVLGGKISAALLFLPVAYVLLFMLSFGVAMIMSICTVYFRDLQHLVTILMQALLFLTPVFYKPDAMQGKVAWIIQLNPLTSFIELFRAPIFLGTLPSLNAVLLAAMFATLSLVAGITFFRSFERYVAFRL